MYKLLIAAQLWFGYHPVVTGPGIPKDTHIIGMQGDLFVLDRPFAYCQDSDGSIVGATMDAYGATVCNPPRRS